MVSTNPELIKLIRFLRKNSNETGASIWDALASKFEKSKHARSSVNLSRINRCTSDGDKVVVPGKVLGAGALEHKVSVAAFSFSEEARRKIEKAGGECMEIPLLVQRAPKGSGVKIIG
jgi:large subunit ribosomal protein L18e